MCREVAAGWIAQGFTANLLLLELFPIIVAVELWGSRLANWSIVLWCDNLGVVQAINNQRCSSPPGVTSASVLSVALLAI